MTAKEFTMNLDLYIITGASRGMGLALAQQLLSTRHRLLCISRQANPALGQNASELSCQLDQWSMNLEHGIEAANRLTQWLHSLDASAISSATLINNAGVLPAIAPLSDCDAIDLQRALRVDLEAPMLLTAAFLHATEGWAMPRKVLNISSGLGRRAMASQAAYCAAKAGMDHFTRCLALDEALKPQGAKVCSLAPGVIDTDMQVQLRGTDPAVFPDRENFVNLKTGGQLATPTIAASRILSYLARADFGANPVADVRDQ